MTTFASCGHEISSDEGVDVVYLDTEIDHDEEAIVDVLIHAHFCKDCAALETYEFLTPEQVKEWYNK